MRAKYVLSEVMTGLWRNVTMTIAMIMTMAVSLTMLGASLVLYKQIDGMKAKFVNDLSISVYLTADMTTAAQANGLLVQIKQDPLVSSATFISQDEAFAEFEKEEAGQGSDIVADTSSSDLPASIRVKLKDASQFAQFKTQFTSQHGVSNITNEATLLNKVFKVLGALQDLALVLAIAQGLAALLLVANTIQVAAYSKRREVAVMKLVGASNWFIQAPFVFEAMFAGLIGALIAWIALICAKSFLIDGSLAALKSLLGEVEWGTINFLVGPLLVIAGALVSGITGWITLRVYIKK
jgi:cell division transport system permease protein